MKHKVTATPTLARCTWCSAEVPQSEYGTHALIHREAPAMLAALRDLVGALDDLGAMGAPGQEQARAILARIDNA